MRRANILPSYAAALLALAPAAAPAQPAAPAPPVTVTDAWVRVIPGASVAAAYMTLHNGGREPLKVIGVRSPLAKMAMIHETQLVNGVSSMRGHEPLTLPPGASVTLAPGGLHVMLHDLTRALAVGDEVPLELSLEGGARVAVKARVRPLSAE